MDSLDIILWLYRRLLFRRSLNNQIFFQIAIKQFAAFEKCVSCWGRQMSNNKSQWQNTTFTKLVRNVFIGQQLGGCKCSLWLVVGLARTCSRPPFLVSLLCRRMCAEWRERRTITSNILWRHHPGVRPARRRTGLLLRASDLLQLFSNILLKEILPLTASISAIFIAKRSLETLSILLRFKKCADIYGHHFCSNQLDSHY